MAAKLNKNIRYAKFFSLNLSVIKYAFSAELLSHSHPSFTGSFPERKIAESDYSSYICNHFYIKPMKNNTSYVLGSTSIAYTFSATEQPQLLKPEVEAEKQMYNKPNPAY
jgi:hypothetical protein